MGFLSWLGAKTAKTAAPPGSAGEGEEPAPADAVPVAELAEDLAALRTDFERKVRHLLDDLEPVPAGVALVFAEGHGILFQQIAAIVPEHQLAMEPERRRAVAEQRIVKRAQ